MKMYAATLILLFALLSGCSERSTDARKDVDLDTIRKIARESFSGVPGLEQAFIKVYSSVLREDWAATYNYRTKAFRKGTDQATYIATLNRDMKGNDLKELMILSVENVIEENGTGSQSHVIIQTVQGARRTSKTSAIVWTLTSDGWVVDSLGLQGSPLMQKLEF